MQKSVIILIDIQNVRNREHILNMSKDDLYSIIYIILIRATFVVSPIKEIHNRIVIDDDLYTTLEKRIYSLCSCSELINDGNEYILVDVRVFNDFITLVLKNE